MGVITYLTNELENRPFEFSTALVGIIIASSGFSGIVASPVAGLAVDRFGRTKTATIGMLFSMPALFLLVLSNSFIMFVLLFIMLGCGNAIIWAALITLSVEVLPERARGTSSSIFNFFRFLGYAMALILLAGLFSGFGIKPLYFVGGLLVLISIPIINMISIKNNLNNK